MQTREREGGGGFRKARGRQKGNENDGAFRRDAVGGRWRARRGGRVGRLVTSCADVPIHHKLLYSYYVPSDSCHPCRDSVLARAAAGALRFCERIYRPRLALDGTDRDYVTTTARRCHYVHPHDETGVRNGGVFLPGALHRALPNNRKRLRSWRDNWRARFNSYYSMM